MAAQAARCGAEPLLSIESLSKRFGPTRALESVDLDIRTGEIHALAGENGAGKSTLVKVLAGIHRPDRGLIRLGDQELSISSPQTAIDRGLAFIHQDFDLSLNLSVSANLLLNCEPTRWAGLIDLRRERQIAREHLDRVGLDLDPGQPVSELGTAERQLLAIARGLSRSCRLLVMDEPTSALAADDIERLLKLIRRLGRQGTSVLFISHKLEEMFSICERITVLRDGSNVGTLETAACAAADIVALMTGRPVEPPRQRLGHAAGDHILQVDDLHSPRVHGVSFCLDRGEILGLYGLKGAGRTALARTLVGLEPKTRGKLYLDGRPVHSQTPRKAILGGLAYASRDRKIFGLFPNLDIRENLSIAALDRFARMGLLRRSGETSAVRELLDRLQVRHAGLSQSIGDLSGGNQQKVILARWLMTRPKVLVLDEPTAGIDVGSKRELYGLIEALAEEGVAVLLISSELPEILELSDRVLVMHEGRQVGQFHRGEASEEAVMKAIFASELG